jgi:hypothetical protein
MRAPSKDNSRKYRGMDKHGKMKQKSESVTYIDFKGTDHNYQTTNKISAIIGRPRIKARSTCLPG